MVVVLVVLQTVVLIKEWEDMLEQMDKIDFVDALFVHLHLWEADFASMRNQDGSSNLDCMSLKMDQQKVFHNYSMHLLARHKNQGTQLWKGTFVLYAQDLHKQSMFHFELD